MAQYRNLKGQFTGSAGGYTLKFTKSGDWDGCSIMLNSLAKAPQEIQDCLPEIAATIIAPALAETKASGDFAPNSPVTIALKGGNLPPWNGGTGVTGEPAVFGAGKGVEVMLSGDQDIIAAVNEGFFNTWANEEIEGRNLYQKTWENCEDKVKSRIDDILRAYTAFS